ncbi:hypothetical protein [Legionella jordanis]|uniref:Sel1 repeat family protein n=1 Tax=Legionella jordanis TaxID=456 RepID=A0A0W0VCE4_9GAMM|nr:hypothetical protein [Legionella jordanis]KTD17759.1 hypothetical protein Ljor_2065 [Legionella jordanis]RMX02535.1 hypothetical protein EAW55_09850 [Legionella jordanis]RMX21617.1 hypothetical protein EAS68_02345 [Legionella jordanis]VEH11305.1 Uncharacterised protein [Legionella jordanis]
MWLQIRKNDLERRKRIGEIFGEGCINNGEDYAAASLIYQHGDVSDHYYQAFHWALLAKEKGVSKAKYLVALTLDHYLVSIGKNSYSEVRRI